MHLTMARLHSRERLVVAIALGVLTLLAWSYLVITGTSRHVDMPMSLPASGEWGLDMAAISALMWCVMMVAMMLPSASPMILTYTRVHQQRMAHGRAIAPTWCFIAGYLATWMGFGLLAAATQWGLQQSTLISSTMGKAGPSLGGGLLILAGSFQFSQLKRACLSKCRSPLSFLMTEWRDGTAGALTMGIRHGAYCIGCCWALMLLMFVGGVMSLAWMAALALLFLMEKLVPHAHHVSRLIGGLLIAAGLGILILSS